MKIRPVKTVEEYHACEKIQKAVWQFEDREIIPVNELITIQRIGGLVLGAFDKGRLIGFLFGLIELRHGMMSHSSRMLAVLPPYRDSGIGFKLKLAQRKIVLKQGIKRITWTFDPLQAKNAYFNMAKLGCTCRLYFVNLYGTSSSVLNSGMETDRFLAEWELDMPLPKPGHVRLDGAAFANTTERGKGGFPVCIPVKLPSNAGKALVEIPGDINAIMKSAPELACEWRFKTRKIFMALLGKGFVVTDFVRFTDKTGARYFYLLKK